MGSATDVADGLEALHEKGVDGILTFWFDFDDGMARFGEGVMPLLEARGLREPFTPPMVQPDWDWPYRTDYGRVTDPVSVTVHFKNRCATR